MIEVNGLGSVECLSRYGDAIEVVNSARVSLGKETYSIREEDLRLLRYLIVNEHTSPFRHVFFTFRLRLPLFVLRQWNKHQVGCAWNEQSGRYVEFDPKFGTLEWRVQSGSVKQGSGGLVAPEVKSEADALYKKVVEFAYDSYTELLKMGVCKEQARALLPQSLMTECWWSCSLHALLHFLDLRLDQHAQKEIRLFAHAVKEEALKSSEMRWIGDLWLQIGAETRRAKRKFKNKLDA